MPAPDIADLFPPDKPLQDQLQNIATALRGLSRENAPARLATIPCPLCRTTGRFALFEKGPHVGIVCLGCGREHPFRTLRVMWLPHEAKP